MEQSNGKNNETKFEESLKYSKERTTLFENTLKMEEKAYDNQMAFSTRYPLNISILFSASFLCDVSLLTTFDYHAFKLFFESCKQPMALFSDFMIILALLGLLSTIIGSIFGAKVILPKPIKFLNTDAVKKNVDVINVDDIDDQSKEGIEKYFSVENNKYLHQQIVDFAGMAKKEREANEKRINSQRISVICLMVGMLLLVTSYLVLTFLIK